MTDLRLKERFEETKEKILKELDKREVCGIFHATRHVGRFNDILEILYFEDEIEHDTYRKYSELINDLVGYIIDVAVEMDNDIMHLRLDIEYLERRKDSETDK